MRRHPFILSTIIGFVLIGGMIWAQNLNRVPSSDLLASASGTRTSTTITNMLADIGSRRVTVMLDAGDWVMATNVTFPTNVTLLITPNARIYVNTNQTVTINGELVAGVYEIFAGPGTVSGSPVYPYRHSEWGSTSQYDIGTGYLQTYVTNTLADYATIAYTTNLVSTTSNDLRSYINISITNIGNTAYVRWISSNTTVNITTNDTYETIQAKVRNIMWIDVGATLTYKFADGTYTFTNALDFFDSFQGPGTVQIIGNTGTPASCHIILNNTNVNLFAASDNGRIQFVDGFLLGSTVNPGSGTSNVGRCCAFYADNASTIDIGTNVVATNFNVGYHSRMHSFIRADNCVADDCDIGFRSAVGSTMIAHNSVARNCARGYSAATRSFLYAENATAYTNSSYGFIAHGASVIMLSSPTVAGNGADYSPATNQVPSTNVTHNSFSYINLD